MILRVLGEEQQVPAGSGSELQQLVVGVGVVAYHDLLLAQSATDARRGQLMEHDATLGEMAVPGHLVTDRRTVAGRRR
jgi:hypothetical protein